MNLMRKASQTWSLKAPNFTLTMNCIPASAVKLPNVSDGGCLWSHQVSQERCTTKLQVPQKAMQTWPAAEGKIILQRKRRVWHRTWQHGWHQRGKRLNGEERLPLRPAHRQPPRWDHSAKGEGGWHHAVFAETKHPGYPLGLHFDNILNFLLVYIYSLFSLENSQDC